MELDLQSGGRESTARSCVASVVDTDPLLCSSEEVNYLEGTGRGTIIIKLGKGDRVLAFIVATGDADRLTVVTSRGAKKVISTAKYHKTSRAGRGRELLKNGALTGVEWPEVTAPPALTEEEL